MAGIPNPMLSSNITVLHSTGSAFAAVREDGMAATWGDVSSGGDSSAVAS